MEDKKIHITFILSQGFTKASVCGKFLSQTELTERLSKQWKYVFSLNNFKYIWPLTPFSFYVLHGDLAFMHLF